jgi:hypothetical protein
MSKANDRVIKQAIKVVRATAYLKDDEFAKLPIELQESLTDLTAAYNRVRRKQRNKVT